MYIAIDNIIIAKTGGICIDTAPNTFTEITCSSVIFSQKYWNLRREITDILFEYGNAIVKIPKCYENGYAYNVDKYCACENIRNLIKIIYKTPVSLYGRETAIISLSNYQVCKDIKNYVPDLPVYTSLEYNYCVNCEGKILSPNLKCWACENGI